MMKFKKILAIIINIAIITLLIVYFTCVFHKSDYKGYVKGHVVTGTKLFAHRALAEE